jgi:hypothetical protein
MVVSNYYRLINNVIFNKETKQGDKKNKGKWNLFIHEAQL